MGLGPRLLVGEIALGDMGGCKKEDKVGLLRVKWGTSAGVRGQRRRGQEGKDRVGWEASSLRGIAGEPRRATFGVAGSNSHEFARIEFGTNSLEVGGIIYRLSL